MEAADARDLATIGESKELELTRPAISVRRKSMSFGAQGGGQWRYLNGRGCRVRGGCERACGPRPRRRTRRRLGGASGLSAVVGAPSGPIGGPYRGSGKLGLGRRW